MLQRLPVILAVTAASYGLQLPAHAARVTGATARQNTATLPIGSGTGALAKPVAKRRRA